MQTLLKYRQHKSHGVTSYIHPIDTIACASSSTSRWTKKLDIFLKIYNSYMITEKGNIKMYITSRLIWTLEKIF